MKRSVSTVVSAFGLCLAVGACSASRGSQFGDSDDAGATSGSTGAEGSGGATGSTGNGFDPSGSTGTGSGNECYADPNNDEDLDGFTGNQGDCNDCDPNVNP